MAGILKKQKVTTSGKPKATLSFAKSAEPKHKKAIASKKEESSDDDEEDDDSIDSSSGEELDLDAEASSSADEADDDDDDDDDDEPDLDGVSSDGDSDEDDDDGENYPELKKNKKGKNNDGSTEFASAVNALLDTKLKAYNRKDPILVRSKKQIKQLESDKLEQKARRALLAEKKARLTASRVRDILPQNDEEAREILEKEKKYRKVAQRGVIKLFNAILMTQTETTKEISKEKIIGETKKKELINEISKEKFLDLVSAAGKST